MTDDELFLTAILKCKRSELYLRSIELTVKQKTIYVDMQRRREAGEPVQYITGFTEFLGHQINVSPFVLIPRPETECLVDLVIKELKRLGVNGPFVLDIGTGSGCVPIALVKEVSGCRVVGIDVSAQAIDQAKVNAQINGVVDHIEWIERDVFWFMDETAHRFDVVVSNPPYIPEFALDDLPMEVKQEPWLALDGGSDGLHFYRYIIPSALRVLKAGGLLALEFGDGQRKELENLFDQTGGWDTIRFEKDLAGRFRVALATKTLDTRH